MEVAQIIITVILTLLLAYIGVFHDRHEVEEYSVLEGRIKTTKYGRLFKVLVGIAIVLTIVLGGVQYFISNNNDSKTVQLQSSIDTCNANNSKLEKRIDSLQKDQEFYIGYQMGHTPMQEDQMGQIRDAQVALNSKVGKPEPEMAILELFPGVTPNPSFKKTNRGYKFSVSVFSGNGIAACNINRMVGVVGDSAGKLFYLGSTGWVTERGESMYDTNKYLPLTVNITDTAFSDYQNIFIVTEVKYTDKNGILMPRYLRIYQVYKDERIEPAATKRYDNIEDFLDKRKVLMP